MRRWLRVTVCASLVGLAGCSTAPPRLPDDPPPSRVEPPKVDPRPSPPRPGAYYKDDGPGDAPANLDQIPDAVPRAEPLHRFANRPYTVLGQNYVPETTLKPYRQQGVASWYGRKYHGQKTSTGETYDMYAMTAAHPTLPIPSYARVTSLKTGRSVVVRVNDRGPFLADRLIDLSYSAAYRLGIQQAGSGPVEVETILPGQTPELVAASAPNKRLASTEPTVRTRAPAAAAPLEQAGNGVFLQLAAFSSRENADAFASRVRADLGEQGSRLDTFVRDGVYRVQLGPYPSREVAMLAADQVQQALVVRPVITQR